MTGTVTLHNVRKAFPGVVALDDVSLEMQAGAVHALMGENGAGKSTLIKVLTGVYRPDRGQIAVDGNAIHPRTPRDAEHAGISTVYQEVNLVATLSVAENVMLGRQPTRWGFIRHRAQRRIAQAALARVGLDIDVTRELGTYPVAVQQLVAIARALHLKARALILDEPTSSLDDHEVATLFELLRSLRQRGLAILFVTHFIDQVYAIADTITVLRNGRHVSTGPARELPRLELISRMLGRAFAPAEGTAGSSGAALAGDAWLEASNLGRRGAVSGVHITLRRGEMLGLAGLLGSGRSETARLLFGADRPDTGEIRVDGQQVRLGAPRRAIRLGFGYCTEERKADGVCPSLSVRENLLLALQARRGPLRRLSTTEQFQLVNHYIQSLDIRAPSPETPLRMLSGGNQQKVLLARWLILQPRLLILDEPTRGIDVGAKQEIAAIVHQLRSEGLAVIFISSELEEVARLCQRVLVLRDRRPAGELQGEDVTEDRIMQVIAG